MSNVIVVGAGAAGMMAAIAAARQGHAVTILEKNEKAGKKLFLTGKGRCNLTNACGMDALFSSVVSNPRFLYSSLYGFDNGMTRDFFESLGLRTKVERGDRVFPVSDHSSDVIRVLERELKRVGVKVLFHTEVWEVCQKDGAFSGVILTDGRRMSADACIIATGGKSYASTGSTGDGYRFAAALGHSLTPRRPALVPMETREDWVKSLQGLSLRNVRVTILDKKKKLYEEFGEMLFTHFGVSGPLILSASSLVGRRLQETELTLEINLKPALSDAQLDQRLLRDFEKYANRQFKNCLEDLFPAKLIPVMVEKSGIDPEKKVHMVTRKERQALAGQIRRLSMTLTNLRGFSEAIVTQGGVSTKEIDPGTMESRLVKGVYFAGEVLDLDAVTGGFNLQIAWSTGYAAGCAVL